MLSLGTSMFNGNVQEMYSYSVSKNSISSSRYFTSTRCFDAKPRNRACYMGMCRNVQFLISDGRIHKRS